MPKLSKKQQSALEQLRLATEPMFVKQLTKAVGCGMSVLTALVTKGYARKSMERVDLQSARTVENSEPPAALQLNADQEKVCQQFLTAVDDGGFRPFLLHGVTGSGKTELYLRAMEAVIAQGKQVLVLVPEISLTPQTIQRFEGRCGEVAVLHSHLRNAERGGQWRRIRTGNVQVIVGARSAVFAPTHNLGLIVIDEEHETSFKQESTPRYHARDVAVMRARLESIPIIMGSATPSLESWHNANRGQYTLCTLPTRVMDRAMPNVSTIDLRHDLPRGTPFTGLSPRLQQAMNRALLEGGQVILLLNRRGFSTHVHCLACGHVEMCKFCDLALTYHQHRDVNLCHHCGYDPEPQQMCPRLRARASALSGFGNGKTRSGDCQTVFRLRCAAHGQRYDAPTGESRQIVDGVSQW